MARQPYHEGERAAHRRFGVTDAADAIADMITDRLSLGSGASSKPGPWCSSPPPMRPAGRSAP
ncbi:hypothetical protein ACFQ4K_24675 [Tistrella bauzanensis]